MAEGFAVTLTPHCMLESLRELFKNTAAWAPTLAFKSEKLGWSLDCESFIKLPGDPDVQPRLRCTAVSDT